MSRFQSAHDELAAGKVKKPSVQDVNERGFAHGARGGKPNKPVAANKAKTMAAGKPNHPGNVTQGRYSEKKNMATGVASRPTIPKKYSENRSNSTTGPRPTIPKRYA